MALVCHCFTIRDRTVHDVALAAGGDLDRVQEMCGAGTACGGCLDEVARLVAQMQTRSEAGAA
jgi:bacterioferritin-associated ferredoxin